MNEHLYTEKELLEYLGRTTTKRQGVDRLTVMCRQAGLIIAPIADTLKGKGSQIMYRIIEDNYKIPNEIWVDTYLSTEHEVSNLGRVRQKNSKKLLGYDNGKGYLGIQINGINTTIHRLVFFSFNLEQLPYEKQITIDHINGIRTDNRLENLRPLTRLENTQAMDVQQTKIKSLSYQLIQKFGYENAIEKIQQLLNDN